MNQSSDSVVDSHLICTYTRATSIQCPMTYTLYIRKWSRVYELVMFTNRVNRVSFKNENFKWQRFDKEGDHEVLYYTKFLFFMYLIVLYR